MSSSTDKNLNTSLAKDGTSISTNRIVPKPIIMTPLAKPATIESAKIPSQVQSNDVSNYNMYKSNVARIIRIPTVGGAASGDSESKRPIMTTAGVCKFPTNYVTHAPIIVSNASKYTGTRVSNDGKLNKMPWPIPVTSIITVPKATTTAIPAPRITIPEKADVTLTPRNATKTTIANKLPHISFVHSSFKGKHVRALPIKVSMGPQPTQATVPLTQSLLVDKAANDRRSQQVLQKVTPLNNRPLAAINGSKPINAHTAKIDEPRQISEATASNVIKMKLPTSALSNLKSTLTTSIHTSSVIQSQAGASQPMSIPRNVRSQLEQEYTKMAQNSGLMPMEMQEAMAEFRKWRFHNDPDEKMCINALNKKLTEFFENIRNKPNLNRKRLSGAAAPQPMIVDESSKATLLLLDAERQNSKNPSSDESESNTDSSSSDYSEPEIKKRIIEKPSAEAASTVGSQAAEVARNETEIDTLNLNKGINVQIASGSLLNEQSMQKAPKAGSTASTFVDLTTTPTEDATSRKSSTNSLNGSAGHSKIQILNGQLSDLGGPIKLMNKMENVTTPATSTTSTEANPRSIDGASKSNFIDASNIHQSLLNIFNQQNSKQVTEVRNKNVEQLKRSTRRARSLSLSGNRAPNPKSRFKNIELARQIRATLNADDSAGQVKPMQVDEKIMKTVLMPERRILGKSKQKIYLNFNHSDENTGPLATEPPSGQLVIDALSWNTSSGAGKLSNTSIVFERNEYGMIEFKTAGEMFVRTEGRQSPKVYGKRSKRIIDDSNAERTHLICGHHDFTECFNEIASRTEHPDYVVISGRKPYEYFSNEYKNLIRSAIQRAKGRCDLVTSSKITEAMIVSDNFKLPVTLNGFSWLEHIDRSRDKSSNLGPITAAPLNLFSNAYPCAFNRFVVGHKLEAIDPQNCALFCVCTVVEKRGFRIKLHFDGYHKSYDFWVNADSKDIFPAGWCNKTARELNAPRKRLANNRLAGFDWKEYLTASKSLSAPGSCFPHLNSASTSKNPFKIGMKLEADDIKFTRRICVATVGDVLDTRILVTFDGLDDSSNYWADISSPYIHPVNWHLENGYSVTPPQDMKTFNWSSYLRSNRAEAAPNHAFCTRKPTEFSIGMAIEIVDKKNPSLLRPAVITMVDEYEVKVLFIGWPEKYAYWVDDDSPDLHPINWAKKTGHPLELPPSDSPKDVKLNGCGIHGCSSIGNFKRPEIETHNTLEECPYEMSNWLCANLQTRPNRIEQRKNRAVPQSGSSGGRIRVNRNPALTSAQISLQPALNPIELATMSPKRVQAFRRLQVSARHLIKNFDHLNQLRDHWINKIEPVQPVELSASLKNPLNWSVGEVASFVSQLPNCSMIGQTFIQHDIDGIAFLSLRRSDMVDIMGLSLGTAIKVFNRILFLREECNAHYIKYA